MTLECLEGLEFVEPFLPHRSVRVPDKTDGLELFNPASGHGRSHVPIIELFVLVSLSLDPPGKHRIVRIRVRDTAVTMLEFVLDEFLELDLPLFLLIRPETRSHLFGGW